MTAGPRQRSGIPNRAEPDRFDGEISVEGTPGPLRVRIDRPTDPHGWQSSAIRVQVPPGSTGGGALIVRIDEIGHPLHGWSTRALWCTDDLGATYYLCSEDPFAPTPPSASSW